MSEITRAVRAAGRRLFIMEILRALVFSAFIALAFMTLLRITQQLFGFSVDWRTIMILAGSVTLAGTFVWSVVARPRDAKSALVLDERANLRESLSTALSIGTPKEPWAQLVVESARQKAATVKVAHAIPIEAPSRWHWPLAALLALGIAWCLPTWDVLGRKAKRDEEVSRKQEIITVKQEIQDNKKKLDEMLAKVAPELKSEQSDPSKPEAQQPQASVQKPDQLRTAEMKRLTDLAEKLQAKTNGEKGMQQDALKDLLNQLKHPGESDLNELYKNLSKGDFKSANEALEELKAKLAKGEMTAEERKKLAEALEKLSEQLAKQSENAEKDVAKALEQAGADPKQASEMAKQMSSASAEDIKKALEAMKNLTPEQREKLAKEIASKCNACKNAGKMSKSMKKCSGGMNQGEMGEASEGLSELGEQLSENEMSEQEIKEMQQALKECQSQMACLGGQCQGNGEGEAEGWKTQTGEWKAGDSNKMGGNGGGGGPGKGQGDRSGSTATEFATERQKANVKAGKGQIIGKQYVKGETVVGASAAEYAEVVEASGKAAAEALSSGEVPPELRKTVQSYFGKLKEKAQPAASQPAGQPASQPEKK